MCGLGRLYSKQNIIEQLLDREKQMPESCQHIKSLKDVRDLQLTPNPTYNKDEDKTEGLLDVRSAPYICKLIGIEMSGKFRFVALWSCGCVFSERALIEIGAKICSLCQKPFTEADIVILNGTEEDVAAMRVKMESRSARRKADKKSSKKKNTASSTITTSTEGTTSNDTITIKTEIENGIAVEIEPSIPIVSTKIVKTEFINAEKTAVKAGPSGIKSSTSKILKRSGATDAMLDPEMKKLKEMGSSSVAADPKATEVFKSLFTSHKTAHEQDRAHWVTYNPFYN